MDPIIGITLVFIAIISFIVSIRLYASSLQEKEPLPYKVIVLGPSSAGKTVFLASMFHHLSLPGNGTGFTIETDFEHMRLLNGVYAQVADPRKDFPSGTRTAIDYQFTCWVDAARNHRYKILEFMYLDFAGGILTSTTEAPSEEFKNKLKQADVLMGILDGVKVLALMNGEDAGFEFLFVDLTNVLNVMGAHEIPIPIHFIVSKWDLLQGHYTLEQILDKLLTFRAFQQFVDFRIQHDTVRLIPVSSVGEGFAELQPNGEMKKIPGKLPHPSWVEMPLICVLADQFKHRVKKLNNFTILLLKRLADVADPVAKTVFDWLVTMVLQTLVVIVMVFLQSIVTGRPAEWASLSLLRVSFGFKNSAPSPERRSGIRVQQVQNKITAMKQATDQCVILLDKLERDFPASNLTTYLLTQKGGTNS